MEHSQRILKLIEESSFTEYRIAKDTGISLSLKSYYVEGGVTT